VEECLNDSRVWRNLLSLSSRQISWKGRLRNAPSCVGISSFPFNAVQEVLTRIEVVPLLRRIRRFLGHRQEIGSRVELVHGPRPDQPGDPALLFGPSFRHEVV